MKKKYRNAYNCVNHKCRLSTGKGLVEQSHKKFCDINYIVSQGIENAIPSNSIDVDASISDYSEFDFQNAQNKIANANSLFEQLPDELRSKFEGSPQKFVEFAMDKGNYDDMVALGLASPKKSSEIENMEVEKSAKSDKSDKSDEFDE